MISYTFTYMSEMKGVGKFFNLGGYDSTDSTLKLQ